MRIQSKTMALGGVTAALAVVIMTMGTLIPVATYACPAMCMILLSRLCPVLGNRLSVVWYVCVAILSILLAPDKEAAAVFLFLGYYPIVKPVLDKSRLSLLWKLLLFNASVLIMYWLLIHAMGLEQISQEFQQVGTVMTLVTLVLGNVVFFLLDWLLGAKFKKRMRK